MTYHFQLLKLDFCIFILHIFLFIYKLAFLFTIHMTFLQNQVNMIEEIEKHFFFVKIKLFLMSKCQKIGMNNSYVFFTIIIRYIKTNLSLIHDRETKTQGFLGLDNISIIHNFQQILISCKSKFHFPMTATVKFAVKN